MAGNSKERGKADRRPIRMQAHEVNYLKAKYGVTGQQVIGAIRVVGNSRPKIEAYLRQKASEPYEGPPSLAGVIPQGAR